MRSTEFKTHQKFILRQEYANKNTEIIKGTSGAERVPNKLKENIKIYFWISQFSIQNIIKAV